jgi:glycerol kinase
MFALLNTGVERIASSNRLLTTIAYQLQGRRTYALEGAILSPAPLCNGYAIA